MRADNLARWHDRMERAAALLDARLDDPPSLEELAAAAHVSPFHFHRIWRGLTGEAIGATITRLRVEKAQALLARGDTRVTTAAMATGYATPQSFARAFRAKTGMTPSEYASGRVVPITSAPNDAVVRLEVRDGIRVVAYRHEGGAYVALNAAFQRVWDWGAAAGRLAAFSGIYGVPLDDPDSVPVEDLRYDACMDFGPAEPAPPLRVLDLPTGRHAVVRHTGSYDGLEALDQWLVGDWLPASGHEPADAPLYHRFHNDPESTAEADLVTDVLLPLAGPTS